MLKTVNRKLPKPILWNKTALQENILTCQQNSHQKLSPEPWTFNLRHCECETLYLIYAQVCNGDNGILKHWRCLWCLHFKKKRLWICTEPCAVLEGRLAVYAFSQSRGDVSRSTNVNITAQVGELSNTLTHNLFQLTLTQYECVIMCISKMPSAPLSLLNIRNTSIVLPHLASVNMHIEHESILCSVCIWSFLSNYSSWCCYWRIFYDISPVSIIHI